MSSIHRVAPEERVEGQPTPRMSREQAVQTDGMWAGFVRMDAGMISGWHHHGSYESSIHVSTGSLRMEFGPGGERSFDAGPATSWAKGVVHRECDPSDDIGTIVVVRAGEGEPVVNVDGPE